MTFITCVTMAILSLMYYTLTTLSCHVVKAQLGCHRVKSHDLTTHMCDKGLYQKNNAVFVAFFVGKEHNKMAAKVP